MKFLIGLAAGAFLVWVAMWAIFLVLGMTH